MVAFTPQQQSEVVATETVWHTKPYKLSSTGPGVVGRQQPSPEAARAGPHGWGLPSLLIWYALCAEMLRQKVQLIGCGLEGQLVQLFL